MTISADHIGGSTMASRKESVNGGSLETPGWPAASAARAGP